MMIIVISLLYTNESLPGERASNYSYGKKEHDDSKSPSSSACSRMEDTHVSHHTIVNWIVREGTLRTNEGKMLLHYSYIKDSFA